MQGAVGVATDGDPGRSVSISGDLRSGDLRSGDLWRDDLRTDDLRTGARRPRRLEAAYDENDFRSPDAGNGRPSGQAARPAGPAAAWRFLEDRRAGVFLLDAGPAASGVFPVRADAPCDFADRLNGHGV